MTGDVEVLAAGRRVDLGEDAHLVLGEQGAHLLDVAGVARVDVDDRERVAGVDGR